MSSSQSNSHGLEASQHERSRIPIIAICTTMYQDLNEIRCQLALRFARKAKQYGITALFVDTSADESIRVAMGEAGASVIEENAAAEKGKGVSYRFGIRHVLQNVDKYIDFSNTETSNRNGNQPQSHPEYYICITEPEKADMPRCLVENAQRILNSSASILIPFRTDIGFDTLPIEQRHSEKFANLYLRTIVNNLASKSNPRLNNSANVSTYVESDILSASSITTLAQMDWYFGPVLFRSSVGHYWAEYNGRMWDAQIVPYINAWTVGVVIENLIVDFKYEPEQKLDEEGSEFYVKKRLLQLNSVIPILTDELAKAFSKRFPGA